MYLIKPKEEERAFIKHTLQELSEYYQRPITDRQMEMYIDDLVEMGPELTTRAALEYRRHWGNSQFPLPGQLRGQIKFISREMYVDHAIFRQEVERKLDLVEPEESD